MTSREPDGTADGLRPKGTGPDARHSRAIPRRGPKADGTEEKQRRHPTPNQTAAAADRRRPLTAARARAEGVTARARRRQAVRHVGTHAIALLRAPWSTPIGHAILLLHEPDPWTRFVSRLSSARVRPVIRFDPKLIALAPS